MTPEDEAFDEIARKQGHWGGGFMAKRAMAADKFIAAEERKVGERYGYVPKLHPSEWMDEPAQEPVACIVKGHLYMAHEFMSGIPEGATLLYTTPPLPERQPLTDKGIDKIHASLFQGPFDFQDILNMRVAARAVEAAHGIGAKP